MTPITKKQELIEFLEAVGWRDVIVPAVEKERARLTRALIDSVSTGTTEYGTPQAIVGQLKGLEWMENFIIKTVEQGLKAERQALNSAIL